MSELAVSLDVLHEIPLMAKLNETELRQIAEICQLVENQAGDYILQYGDESQNLWILLEGRCDVIKPRDPNNPQGDGLTLTTLEPYSVFGEMSFFHKAPHSAHVVAVSPVKLLCIQRRDYDDLIREGAWGAYKLAFSAVASLAERLRHMTEWVADLTRHQPAPAPSVDGRGSEWTCFRERLFANWNL